MNLSLLDVLLSIGLLVGGSGYIVGKFRQGSNKGQFDTVKLFKEQIEALEGKTKTQDEEIKKLRDELEKFRTENKQLQDKLSHTIAILENRDESTQVVYKAIMDYIEVSKPVLAFISSDLKRLLDRLDRFLDKQTF